MIAGDVVIVGHATIDDIHHHDGRRLSGTLGGAALYAASAASLCGARVRLVTCVGDDYPIDRVAADPRIDPTLVRRCGPRSIHNVAHYEADGARTIEIEDWPLLDRLTPDAGNLAGVDLDGAVVLLCAAPLDTQLELAEALRDRDCTVAVDTELHYLRAPEDRSRLVRLLGAADVALPSIAHVQAIFGGAGRDPLEYADELAALGCAQLAVKHGAGGSAVIDARSGRRWRVPPVRGIRVEDPTGAGDAYDGGLAAALARGEDVLTAACWGTVAAAFAVESLGAGPPAGHALATALARFAAVRRAVATHAASDNDHEDASAPR